MSCLDARQTIKDGDWVILDENNEKRSFARIQKSKQIRIGKSTVPCNTLLGAPYGSLFELSADRRSATRLHRPPDMESDLKDLDTAKNNSQLLDENRRNQQLTKEDIEAMKAAGKAGDEIIEALISRSATFKSKTEFSQEKYKKKKAKKYCAYVTLRNPSSSSICQTMFQKDPMRIHNLRPDTLAMMLSFGNVCAHAQVLVVETCCGVVTTSVVERLGGFGRVCALHTNKAAPLDTLQYANFDAEHRGALCTTGLQDILDALTKVKAATEPPPEDPAQDAQQPPTAAAAPTAAVVTATPATEGITASSAAGAAAANPTAGAVESSGMTGVVDATPMTGVVLASTTATEVTATAAATSGVIALAAGAVQASIPAGAAEVPPSNGGEAAPGPAAEVLASVAAEANGVDPEGAAKGVGVSEAPKAESDAAAGQGVAAVPKPHKSFSASAEELEDMARAGFSSALLAAPQVQPLALLDAVWPLLKPSASFVIYSQWMHPLAECLQALHKRRTAVMLQLQESWMRQYQVLPGRTHPEMMTTGTGGYIMSGIKLVPAANESQTEPPKAVTARAGRGEGQGVSEGVTTVEGQTHEVVAGLGGLEPGTTAVIGSKRKVCEVVSGVAEQGGDAKRERTE